jgi:hypothetical protein
VTIRFQIQSSLVDTPGYPLMLTAAGVGNGGQARPTTFLSVNDMLDGFADSQTFVGIPDPDVPGYFFIQSALQSSVNPKQQLVVNIKGVTESTPLPNSELSLLDLVPANKGWHNNQLWTIKVDPTVDPSNASCLIQSLIYDNAGHPESFQSDSRTPYVMNLHGGWSRSNPPPHGTRLDADPRQFGDPRQLWLIYILPPELGQTSVTIGVATTPEWNFINIEGTNVPPGICQIKNFLVWSVGATVPNSDGTTLPTFPVRFDGTFFTGTSVLSAVSSFYMYFQLVSPNGTGSYFQNLGWQPGGYWGVNAKFEGGNVTMGSIGSYLQGTDVVPVANW